jgi:hypothetical protein
MKDADGRVRRVRLSLGLIRHQWGLQAALLLHTSCDVGFLQAH